ncbi:hypothetical protein ACHAXS_001978 [Conticribra weissflogii]
MASLRRTQPSALSCFIFGAMVVSFLTIIRHHTSVIDSSNGACDFPFVQPQPTTKKFFVDIEKACPASLKLNTVTDYLPPAALMDLAEARSLLKYWLEFNCPNSSCQKQPRAERIRTCPSCTFSSVAHYLLRHAIVRNETLLTVQVGAMDGRSNDPMYEMFVKQRTDLFSNLHHWLPVIIEPLPNNYEALLDTYTGIAKMQALGCAVPINAAVSYDIHKTECPFCRVNSAEDSPQKCKDLPDWKRLQIGTLDCENSKRLFGDVFDLCIIQDPLPCSSVSNLLAERNLPYKNIVLLQVDIEGYESVLLPNFLRDVGEMSALPPVIHFEQKVLLELDRKKHSIDGGDPTRLGTVTEALTAKGYVLYDDGEDILALRT